MKTPNRCGPGLARRRFIAIAASMAGSPFVARMPRAETGETFTWRGGALGAEATLTLQHHDEAAAKSAIAACLSEVARLEAIFSLHQPGSALARLNGRGHLEDAPPDLRILLAEALLLAQRTDGAFDPTIQPLWALYARHFAQAIPVWDGPSEAEIESARAHMGWKDIAIEDGHIRLLKPGMAITLNGIAQGYITDRVGDLLRARGFRHVLVNLGEQLALGPKADGRPWTVGVQAPEVQDRLIEQVSLKRGAVATSGGYGCSFDGGGKISHLLDPRTGRPAADHASVTVIAERATSADGLSTALSVMPITDWRRVLDPSAARAFVVHHGAERGFWV